CETARCAGHPCWRGVLRHRVMTKPTVSYRAIRFAQEMPPTTVEMNMERHNSLPSKRVLTQPFGVPLRAVEARAGFVQLVLAFQGGGPGALQEACDLGLRERLEGADGFEGLVEDLLTVDAGDLHSDGQIQAVVQRLNGLNRVAVEDERVPEGLHAEWRDAFAIKHGQHFALEAAEVRIHHVERHLHAVEVEFVLSGEVEHTQVNERVLVACETDIADLAGFLSFHHRFDCTAFSEDAIRVFEADDFVELHQVDAVSLQALKTCVDLPRGFRFGTAIDFVHQEDLLTVAVLEGFGHANFARAFVVIPAVVHEGNAAVDGLADERNRLVLGNRRLADVPATQADDGDAFACAAEGAVDHSIVTAFRQKAA